MTLGDYKRMCETLGFSKAAAYFQEKINEQGPDEKVIADESQMIQLIANMEYGDKTIP